MTSDGEICADVHEIFLQLTRMGQLVPLNRLLQSPFTLRKTLIAWIDNEAEIARSGRPGRIIARMNSLTEHGVIQALYRASQAGVQIDLIIRGICCLRAGVEGVSENIRVRSLVGRLLEHTRVYHFGGGGDAQTFISSADWMYRNLHRRVEVACPIDDPDLRARIFEEVLEWGLRDNQQAWLLQPGGRYVRSSIQDGEEPFRSQESLIARLADHGRHVEALPDDGEQSGKPHRKGKKKDKR
jgi:polyphosphate kinase